MFEFTPQGKRVWNAKIEVPYVGMLHDFAVTREHIVFYVIPLAIDQAQMDERRHSLVVGRHEADVLRLRAPRRRRQGRALDRGSDAQRDARHGRVRRRREARRRRRDVDVESVPVHADARRLALGSRSRARATSRGSRSIYRDGAPSAYGIEQMYPHVGALPRQDDRYNTVPYRYGFLGCPDPNAPPGTGGACYARFDHQNRTSTLFNAGTETIARRVLLRAEEPERAGGRRAISWALRTRNTEDGRSDLVILDAERLADGPVAIVQLPMRALGQVHGWWVPEDQLPAAPG